MSRLGIDYKSSVGCHKKGGILKLDTAMGKMKIEHKAVEMKTY